MVTKANKHIQRRQKKCGRPPISAEIVRQVIKALELNVCKRSPCLANITEFAAPMHLYPVP